MLEWKFEGRTISFHDGLLSSEKKDRTVNLEMLYMLCHQTVGKIHDLAPGRLLVVSWTPRISMQPMSRKRGDPYRILMIKEGAGEAIFGSEGAVFALMAETLGYSTPANFGSWSIL